MGRESYVRIGEISWERECYVKVGEECGESVTLGLWRYVGI